MAPPTQGTNAGPHVQVTVMPLAIAAILFVS